MDFKKYTHHFIVLFFITIIIAHHLYCYMGHYGYDDIGYARIATHLTQGQIDWHDHFFYRIIPVLFTALSYIVFGINDFASALPAIVVNSLGVIVLHQIVRKKGAFISILALSIYVLDCWTLFYADKLMADSYLTTGVLITLYALYKHKFDGGENKPLRYAVWFAGGLIFSFMCKEDIILLTIPYAYLLIVDVFKKRNLQFWKYVALSIVAFLAIYLFGCYLLFNDALIRIHEIYKNDYINSCSYSLQPLKYLVARLSTEFVRMLYASTLIFSFAIILGQLLVQKKRIKEVLQFNSFDDFFVSFFIVAVFSCNFMSVSVKAYNPMCLDIRHYLFLVPIGAVALAVFISTQLAQLASKIMLTIACILVIIGTYYFDVALNITVVRATAVLFIVYAFIPRIKIYTKAFFVVLFIAIQCMYIVTNYKYATIINYPKQRDIITNFIKTHTNSNIVTDEVLYNFNNYFAGFGKYSNCKNLTFYTPNLIDTIKSSTENYLIFNRHTLTLSSNGISSFPPYIKDLDTNVVQLIESYNDIGLDIYKFKQNAFVLTKLMSDTCTLETSPSKNWTVDAGKITTEHKFRGNNGLSVDEYSATFLINLDSTVLQKPFNKLVINTESKCLTQTESNANIVISIEDKNGGYIYSSQLIRRYLEAQGNWHAPFLNEIVPFKNIKPNSILKIYIFNPDKTWLMIDDFTVNLSLKY
jgi:hypothetical protein